MNQIEICFSPALISSYLKKDMVVVVTDILRASTTICTALANGAKSIIPVETEDEALRLHKAGYMTGAEHRVSKVDFADFGNSPLEYSTDKVRDKDIVMTTSNGTRAIKAAQDCYLLLVGGFVNIRAVARRCMAENKDILIVCAGWKNRICVEDSLFAGSLASILLENEHFQAASDGTRIAVTLWHNATNDINNYIMKSEHAQRLLKEGFDEDLKYCLEKNILSVVPELRGNRLIVDKLNNDNWADDEWGTADMQPSYSALEPDKAE